MNAQSLEWGDIPFVLAVCEAGTLSGAARKLGVNHSTVFRRLEGVEKRLGVTLFERLNHGYVMTAAGEHFFRRARILDEGVTAIQRELGGQDLRLEGRLSVTTTDSLVYSLAPVFQSFQQRYPDVELQLLSGTRALDLMQREADVAVRPTQHPPEHWIGRSVLPIAYAPYAHPEYVKFLRKAPREEHRWIRLVDDLNQSPMSKVTAQHKAADAPVTIASALMSVFDLVRGGLGVAALPCYLGENSAELVRLQEPESGFNSELWLLSHPDIRRSAKVHAFFEFATKEIRNLGSRFSDPRPLPKRHWKLGT